MERRVHRRRRRRPRTAASPGRPAPPAPAGIRAPLPTEEGCAWRSAPPQQRCPAPRGHHPPRGGGRTPRRPRQPRRPSGGTPAGAELAAAWRQQADLLPRTFPLRVQSLPRLSFRSHEARHAHARTRTSSEKNGGKPQNAESRPKSTTSDTRILRLSRWRHRLLPDVQAKPFEGGVGREGRRYSRARKGGKRPGRGAAGAAHRAFQSAMRRRLGPAEP